MSMGLEDVEDRLPWYDDLAMTARDDPRVLHVHGVIDLATVPDFRSGLERFTGHGAVRMVVDLTGVRILTAAGIRVLRDVRRTAERRGARIDVVATRGSLTSRVLGLAGLDHCIAEF